MGKETLIVFGSYEIGNSKENLKIGLEMFNLKFAIMDWEDVSVGKVLAINH